MSIVLPLDKIANIVLRNKIWNHNKLSSCTILLPSKSDLPTTEVVGLTAVRPSSPSNVSPPAPARMGRREECEGWVLWDSSSSCYWDSSSHWSNRLPDSPPQLLHQFVYWSKGL